MLYAFCCLQTQENEPATLARLFHCGFLRPLPPTEIPKKEITTLIKRDQEKLSEQSKSKELSGLVGRFLN